MSYIEKKVILTASREEVWQVVKDLKEIGRAFPFVREAEEKKEGVVIWRLDSPADVYLRTDFLEVTTILIEEESQHSWQAKAGGFSLVGVFFLDEPDVSEGVELSARLVFRSDGFFSRFLGTAFFLGLEEYLDEFFQRVKKRLQNS